MIDAAAIEAAYSQLAFAHQTLATSTEAEQRHRTRLEEFKAEAVTRGAIDGKNAETREAQLRTLLKDDHDLVAKAAADVARDRMRLTLAQIEVERCKTLLRLMEVTA